MCEKICLHKDQLYCKSLDSANNPCAGYYGTATDMMNPTRKL